MSNKVAVPPTKDALLKSYRKRLKDDIGSMVANFTEIIKLCQISKSEEECQVSRSTLCEEEAFEMQVRAANMVSLHQIQYLCLNVINNVIPGSVTEMKFKYYF